MVTFFMCKVTGSHLKKKPGHLKKKPGHFNKKPGHFNNKSGHLKKNWVILTKKPGHLKVTGNFYHFFHYSAPFANLEV